MLAEFGGKLAMHDTSFCSIELSTKDKLVRTMLFYQHLEALREVSWFLSLQLAC